MDAEPGHCHEWRLSGITLTLDPPCLQEWVCVLCGAFTVEALGPAAMNPASRDCV